MSKIHAFMRRRYFTCRTCGNNDGGRCSCNGCIIRWNPCQFGCGHYCSGDEPDQPRQMNMEAFR